jgi:PIN domain nuclease of toxin-antitoxin system
MIVLDTHVWVWWVHGDERLTARQSEWLTENEARGLGVSVISCWEVANQIIIATARVHDAPLLTSDEKILAYPHVKTLRQT